MNTPIPRGVRPMDPPGVRERGPGVAAQRRERPVEARVRQLTADADELVELALRLRDLAASLREARLAPRWLDRVLAVQIMRCMTASAHLRRAARRLEEHRAAC